MGEVYRARDVRLQRDVALKLLPASFASDPDRLARFTREAQLLAALNHPNIGAIYGIEDSPSGAVLVLELVEGPTLADRIARGPLPVDESVAIARQISEALESAHEQGVIHRDLKPANLKLRPDGTVKVLDFGLARIAVPAVTGSVNIAASPTLTADMTAAGVILGTAAYMAPEQARGRVVDRRADIWALGVVLFEMLTGTRPFGGETLSETLAAIIKDPPALEALSPGVPGQLRALIARMLEKDPRERLRDIGDARIALREIASGTDRITPVTAARSHQIPRWRTVLPWAVALAGVSVAAVSVSRPLWSRPPAAAAALVKFTLPEISGESLERLALPIISPDGRHVVFSKAGQLWLRSFDELEPRQLPSTNGAQYPFWSPDSRSIAYLTATALWRVGVDGTRPVQIATYGFGKGGRTPGGVWRTDDTIVFAPSATGSSLLSVSLQGGEFKELYARDPKRESDFHRPSLLPDGRSLLFVVDRVDGGPDTLGVLVEGKRKDILTISGEVLDSPVYSPTGHILYHRETTTPGVWALPFSLQTLEATGATFLVGPQASYPSVSQTGTLIFADNSVTGESTLAWLDIESGVTTPALKERFPTMAFPRLSPNGKLVAAVAQSPGEWQVVIVADLQRGTHTKLATRVTSATRLAWRDDETLLWTRSDGADYSVVMRAANGSGHESVLVKGLTPSVGRGTLFFNAEQPGTAGDLYRLVLPPGGATGGTPELIQQSPIHESEPVLSPDGMLLAYTSGDRGQSEIILRTYPELRGQWQVSATGGSIPVWSRAGDALYYKDVPGEIMRVAVQSKPSVTLGTPRRIARPSNLLARVGFDISLDGRRLLMVQEVKTDEQRSASLAVVQNWVAGEKK